MSQQFSIPTLNNLLSNSTSLLLSYSLLNLLSHLFASGRQSSLYDLLFSLLDFADLHSLLNSTSFDSHSLLFASSPILI
ncbi:hypothetical protein PGT21_016955 [Puccinia graminis f. sp. tritici]|uniref:Uncharacterized protein n=1 Tax=Puccinia graminis f. sp. tritici TaxID=56615 RepID=A0A5B0QIS1_PUCGR|nr:hypothetical protein PGT21_016955 [Puccinia graminis f. sp. tritici]